MFKIITMARFGNNISQLIKAICLAKEMGITKIEHSFTFLTNSTIYLEGLQNNLELKQLHIKCKNIDCNFAKESRFREIPYLYCCIACETNNGHNLKCEKRVFKDTEYLLTGGFFYGLEEKYFLKNRYRSRTEICELANKYIKPLLIYQRVTGFEEYYEESLFIHIRSGDIFTSNNPHPAYTQPPLDFYIKIIDKENRFPIFFVEDEKNPVVNELKKLYPSSHFSTRSVEFLIGVFINALYIVSGKGTFIPSIIIFNNNFVKHYNKNSAKFPGYIDKWCNTDEQHKLMITYTDTEILTPYKSIM